MSELCPECQRGFPCLNDPKCERASNASTSEITSGQINDIYDEYDAEEHEISWRFANTRGKRDSSLKDQQSTGRKRAAKLYPLDRTARCQWSNASGENRMGGGKVPVPFGCNNLQQCRHHGPDKNTLNNEQGNVHRICHWHHNNWHQLNDENYDWANAGKNVKD